MLGTRFDPTSFFAATEHVALCVPASEVFSLLKRRLELPNSWAALVIRELGDFQAVGPGGTIESEGVETVVFARSTPIDLEVETPALRSRDGFTCAAHVRIRVSIAPDRAELRSFRDQMLGSHRVMDLQRLAGYFQPHVAKALTEIAANHDADDLVSGRADPSHLVSELGRVCFSSGLLFHEADASFHSPAWMQILAAREQAAAQKASQEAASEVEQALNQAREAHLERLTDLLVRLRRLSADHPESPLPDLIRSFDERQRGELYAALFATSPPGAPKTQWLIVAAGDEVLFFSPTDLTSPSRRLRIAGAAGPLRSIHFDGQALILGAATGLYRLPLDRAEPDQTYHVPGAPPVRGGFNSAIRTENHLLAAHSEIGIVCWPGDAPENPTVLFIEHTRNAKTVRELRQRDAVIYCAVDRSILAWDSHDASSPPTCFSGSLAVISAVCPTPYGMFAGNAAGELLHWPIGQWDTPSRIYRGPDRPIESICLAQTHGVPRLIFTDTSPRLHLRVWSDTFESFADAGGQTLRRVEVADDLIVATNELRDRLFCWPGARTDRPPIVIPVARLTGHPIQDVCLL